MKQCLLCGDLATNQAEIMVSVLIRKDSRIRLDTHTAAGLLCSDCEPTMLELLGVTVEEPIA